MLESKQIKSGYCSSKDTILASPPASAPNKNEATKEINKMKMKERKNHLNKFTTEQSFK